MNDTPYLIEYEFRFSDGNIKHFSIELDPHSVTIGPASMQNKPEWTRLDYRKCVCCPLDA